MCLLVWICSVSERVVLQSRAGGVQPLANVSWNVPADAGTVGVYISDYHSLINSPGHVVYIFRCKVEGLYLWMARFESTERERMPCWITFKRKPGHIADISMWIEKTAEINRPHIHYCRMMHKQRDLMSSNKLCLLLKAVPIHRNEYDQYSKQLFSKTPLCVYICHKVW